MPEITVIEVQVSTAPDLVQVSVPGAQGPQGIQGPQGEPGDSGIGGYGFNIENIAADDVLAFSGTAWVNRPQVRLTDGGNF